MQPRRARWQRWVFWPGLGNRLALLFALLLLAGCRSTDNFSRILNEPAPLPEPVRASFGTVGLLPPGADVAFRLEGPASRAEILTVRSAQTFATLSQAAFSGSEDREPFAHRVGDKPEPPRTRPPASQGNLVHSVPPSPPERKHPDHEAGKFPGARQDHSGFADHLGEEGSQILAGLLVIGAVSLADGLVEALFLGESKAEVKQSELAIRQALQEAPLQPGIQNALSECATGKTSKPLAFIPESALSSATNELARTLSRRGIHSLLTLRITEQGFVPTDDLTHTLCFVAEVEVVVTRLSDGKVLHAGCLDYQSRSRRFSEWGAHQAKYLRAELREAQRQLAAAMLEQMFAPDPAPITH